jgi:hypothetical protein
MKRISALVYLPYIALLAAGNNCHSFNNQKLSPFCLGPWFKKKCANSTLVGGAEEGTPFAIAVDKANGVFTSQAPPAVKLVGLTDAVALKSEGQLLVIKTVM